MERVRPILRHNWQVIYATFVGGLAVILSAFIWLSWSGYQSAEQQAAVAVSNIVKTVSNAVDTTVGRIESDLNVLAPQITARDLTGTTDAARRAEIETQMALHLRMFRGALGYRVFNAAGRPIFSAGHQTSSLLPVTDQDWFRTLRDAPDREAVVSDLMAPGEGEAPTFIVAIALRDDTGLFRGALAAPVDIGMLQSDVDGLSIGEHGLITLRNLYDGTILLRSPSPPDLIDHIAQGSDTAVRIFSSNASGQGEMVFPLDHLTRRYAFQTIPAYNLGVVAALASVDYLGPWRHQSIWTGVLVIILVAGLTALFLYQIKTQSELRQFTFMLTQSEARFRSLVEGTTDWVWETDADHRLIWTSSSIEGIFHLPADYFIGKRREDIASAQREVDVNEWKRYMSLMNARQSFRDFRYWLNDGHGTPRWISVNGSPRYDKDGVFLGFRGSGSDVTAQFETASQLRLLSAVVEHWPISVVITSEDSIIQYVNSQAARQSGYDPVELIGKHVSLLESNFAQPRTVNALHRAMLTTTPWSGDIQSRQKNGKSIWEHISLNFIRDDFGAIRHHVWLREDISARKIFEIQLLAANRTLDAQAAQLKSVNAELEQFAYVASHDLRQPLRMISSYMDLIQEALTGTMTEQLQTYFGHAINGARRMDRLILDLLEYSRTGRDMVLEPVSVAVAVEHARQNLQAAIDETKATIRVADKLPDVMGRLTEITRLFQNLIGNALKYHAPDRLPEIDIGWDIPTSPTIAPESPAPDSSPSGTSASAPPPPHEADQWLFWVKDNGIGIDPKNFERIFRVFQRCVAQDSYEGSGIGLAICKKIVDQLHGRIWVESQPGLSTTFFITLPKSRST